MKKPAAVFLICATLASAGRADEKNWRTQEPDALRNWLVKGQSLAPGGPAATLGKADRVKQPSFAHAPGTHVVWLYQLAGGYQLEAALAKDGAVREYSLWKPLPDGSRRHLWSTKVARIEFQPAPAGRPPRRNPAIPREPFKGDIPPRLYEAGGGGARG